MAYSRRSKQGQRFVVKREYISYRLERAEESLQEAKLLAEHKHFNTAVNRIYYACFYMVDALLTQNDIKHTSHTGTKSQLHKYFGKSERISRELLVFYGQLFQARQTSDYGDQVIMTKEDFEEFYPQALSFRTAILEMIEDE